MAADAPSVVTNLTFEDVKEFQVQYEGLLRTGRCFVLWARPQISGALAHVHLKAGATGETVLCGEVEFNESDDSGRPGLLIALDEASQARAKELYEKSLNVEPLSGPAPVVADPEADIASSAPVPAPGPQPLGDLVGEPPPTPRPSAPPMPIALEKYVEPLVTPEPPAEAAPPVEVAAVDLSVTSVPPAPSTDVAATAETQPPSPDGYLSTRISKLKEEGKLPAPALTGDLTQPEMSAVFAIDVEDAAPPLDAPTPTAEHASLVDSLEPGSILDNRFQIEAHLASGGMGDVFRAQHVYLKRAVALKLMKKSFAADMDMWARFQREAELVSKLENQHIVRVFDFGRTSGGQPYLAMEFVEGTPLDELVKREGPLSAARAVQFLSEICEGLSEAHSLGIIHRDLKPANIIIGSRRDGTEIAKILDFGVARIADNVNAKAGASLTEMGVVVGTPAYFAPEQALADTLDARTDIYALGCVAFALLTGKPPFKAESLQQLVAKHIHEVPPPIESRRPDLAGLPGLSAAIAKALKKNRNDRFARVEDLGAALREGLTPPAPKQPAPAPAAVPAGDVDDFFSVPATKALPKPAALGASSSPTATAPAPASVAPPAAASPARLAKELQTAGIVLAPADVDRLVARRAALEGTSGRGVVLRLEVLRAPPGTPIRASCLKAIAALALELELALDCVDEDGITLLLRDEAAQAPVVAAVLAVADMRDMVVAEGRAMPEGQGPTLRATVAVGTFDVSTEDKPVDSEATRKARALAAKSAPGKTVIDRSLAGEVADAFETVHNFDGVEVGERKEVVKPTGAVVGRDALLAAVDRRLFAASSPPLVVVGEAGSGRSTMALEVAARARKQGMVVGLARGAPALAGHAYSAVTEMLCSLCHVPVEQRFERLGPALEAYRVAGPDLEAALVVAGVRYVPTPFTPGQVVHALRAVVGLVVPGRRVLFAFDALETMDPYSVDAFLTLCARPNPRELTAGFTRADWALERCPEFAPLELSPFSEADSAKFLSGVVGGLFVSNDLVRAVHARSHGLPGPMLDWLQVMAARGWLRVQKGSVLPAHDLPALDAAALYDERVRRVGAEAADLLEALSLSTDALDGPSLKALVPYARPGAYAKLMASGLIRAVGEKRWVVAHESYREASLRRPSSRRMALHARFAGILAERAAATGERVDAARVGLHLNRAREAAPALKAWRTVMEGALARRSPREVYGALRGWADALTVVLETPGAPIEAAKAKVETLARAASNALAMGEPSLSRAAIDEAQTVAEAKQLESAELALAQAKVLRSEARRAKAAESLELALHRAGQGPLRALCLVEKAESLEADGDMAGAEAALAEALTLADKAKDAARMHGEVDLRARVEARLGALLITKKDFQGARQAFLSALAQFRRSTYPYGEARVLANLGSLYVQMKMPDDAAGCFNEASATAARCGDLLFQTRQLINLAKVAKRENSLPIAKQASEAAKRLANLISWEDGQKQAVALMDPVPAAPKRRA